MKKIVTKYVVCYSINYSFKGYIFLINIKFWPGIKLYLSMHQLLKNYSEILLFLTLSRLYNFACVVCKQMEVLPVFLCRAH